MNNLGTFYTNLGKTANKHLNSFATTTNSIGKAANTHLNSFATETAKAANSFVNSTGKALNSGLNSGLNTLNDLLPTNSVPKNISAASASLGTAASSSFTFPVVLFIVISLISIYFIIKHKSTIMLSINNWIQELRSLFGLASTPLVDPSVIPLVNVTESPISPQQDAQIALALPSVTLPAAPAVPAAPTLPSIPSAASIVNAVLPAGNPEVFNVSKNEFPYYDAEPLCEALGAQLATYDQVKEAWSKGADWCNYGWVKGQAAVYPTQQDTWNRIQTGPEENRNSCGTVGLNGGYFENPEMKFGVNCFGIKPLQSEHDEEILMKKGAIPHNVATLAIDKKVQEFKANATNMGILPFNTKQW